MPTQLAIGVASPARRGSSWVPRLPRRVSPALALGVAGLLALSPFLLVELFPSKLYGVMSPPAFLVFHNIAEFFSVMVSLSIFGVGWFTYEQSRDRHALFVSSSFLVIGLIDFMHTLSYPGMPAFVTANSLDKSGQLWVLARGISASAFLASAFVLPGTRGRWLAKRPLGAAAVAVPTAVFALVIAFPRYMPTAFTPGVGLTPFKTGAESAIVGLLVLAALAYWRRMSRTGERVLFYYSLAWLVSVCGEMSFAFYKNAFDSFNVLGHVYKVVSFSLIYVGVFASSVKRPYIKMAAANRRLHTEVTEREQAERAVRESERYLRSLLQNMPAAVVVHGADSAIRYGNPEAQRILGLSEEQLLGKTVYDPGWHFISEDGSATPVDHYPAQRVISSRAPVHGYLLGIVRTSGAAPAWVYVSAFPDLDEQGEVREVIVTFIDVTELKRLQGELETYRGRLEEQVEERTKRLALANKELEAFSYSVSHDLRAPLRAIDGFSLILLEDYRDKLDADGQHLLEVVRGGVRKMSMLIDDILSFSRTGRAEFALSTVDMEALVRGVFAELAAAEKSRDIRLELTPLPVAQGDPVLLRQVFVNLLSNAIKYTRPRSSARVEVGARVEEGETVYFVRDNGVGFDMDYAGKLFGVFQRLHATEQFEGTGIGLAIVKRIIQRHDGRVWAEGKVGEGATISFTLPRRGEGGEGREGGEEGREEEATS